MAGCRARTAVGDRLFPASYVEILRSDTGSNHADYPAAPQALWVIPGLACMTA